MELLNAAFLGIVEGLTEFLPVSSTGHLIVLVDLLGFQGPPGRIFEVVIQLGAVLAILTVYRTKFLGVLRHFRQPSSQHFLRNITLAVLPALVIGALMHETIKTMFFNAQVVAFGLIVGGIAILLIERFKPATTIPDTDDIDTRTALTIGFVQCLAMVPGVSRSGATIMGALLCGVSRPAAAEFSFFLAVPTMIAAVCYDLYVNGATVDSDGWALLAVGFITAFATALVVVRWLVRFVAAHGFAPFAWYRIALGSAILMVTLA
jgi:undecaprenyl-diphosphatase